MKKSISKRVISDSSESVILRKLDVLRPRKFLPILKEKRENLFTTFYFEKMPYTFSALYFKKKMTVKMLKTAWRHIKKQILVLHKLGIIHGDVHMENIVVNGSKDKFFLIDFGESCMKKDFGEYEKLSLRYNQDLYQFLWNIVFLSNKQKQSYEDFGEILRKFPEKSCRKLLKHVEKMWIDGEKRQLKKHLQYFLEKKLEKINSKKKKIIFKFFLERLYLSYIILFVKRDAIYRKLY